MMKIPFTPLTHLGICALVLLLATTGCTRQKDAEIRIAYDVVWDGNPYEVGESAPDVQGRPVQLERLECYVSDFAIHDVDEGWLPIDTVARIDFSRDDAHAVLTIPGEGDRTIDGLRMGLGVPEDRNVDVDPASYTDPDHPLGYTGSAGLHWGWAAGYIFSVYEGRLLTEPNTPFTYHAGDDRTFRTTELMWEEPWLLECGGKDHNITLVLDAYKCLHGAEDTIDPEIDPETHTGNNLPLAIRWVDLYQNAWSIQP